MIEIEVGEIRPMRRIVVPGDVEKFQYAHYE